MAKMNKKLGNLAIEEIRESIRRCANSKQISAEAARLAALNGVSKSRIYELTDDIRPKRKTRADKGRRTGVKPAKLAPASLAAFRMAGIS